MPLNPLTLATLAALAALPAALPLPLEETEPGYAATERPMDDLGGPAYGDLTVFDAVTEIGAAQSADMPYCDHHGVLRTVLGQEFRERPRLKAPLEMGRSVELWASDAAGTWTALYTRADGVSCVVSSGIGWAAGDDPLARLRAEKLLPV